MIFFVVLNEHEKSSSGLFHGVSVVSLDLDLLFRLEMIGKALILDMKGIVAQCLHSFKAALGSNRKVS